MNTLLRTLLLFWLPLTAMAGSTASISGRVTALDGTTPLSGVQVFAFLNGSQVPSSPFTDGNGNYTITGLDTGNYNVGFINPASGQGPQTFGANPVQILFDGQPAGGINKSMAGALTVWNTSDTGTGSLRQRLTAAQGIAGANTVDFDPSLAGQTISISSPLTISDTPGVTLDFSTLTPAGTTTLAGDFGLSGTASVFLKTPPAGSQLNIPGTLALGNNFLTVTGTGSLVFSGSLNNGTLLLGGLLGGTMSVTLQGATGNSSFTASVSSGSLLLAKNNAGGSAPAISANLVQTGGTVTFGGTGNQVAPTAQSAELQTGSGPTFVLTAASTALPNLSWAPGGTVRGALDNAGGPAKMAITGALTKTAGTGAFTFDFQNSGSPGQTYTLATFASSTFAAADFTATGLFPGLTGTFAKTGTTLTFTLAEAPNAFQVSNLSDSGAGSLRNVLAFAASQAGSNTVTFASNLSGQTIPVLSELLVNDAGGVAIDASALPLGITLSGGNARRILHTAAGTALTLRRITFTQGNGVGSDGAGASNGVSGGALRNLGTLHAVDCTFTGNRVANNGGAFANAAGATATLLGCTFTSNQTTGGAANGGAITNGGTLLTLRRCTLSGNSTAAFAGNAASAIYNSAPLILEHCTIAGNTSSSSGGIDAGIYNLYSVGASYCILSGNTGLDVYNDNAAPFGSPTSLSGVNILVNAGGIAIGGTGTRLTSDPLLAALASNGGPTQTRSIPTNSPARNAGTGSTATVDQRGFAMVGVPDLGAYEAGAAAASTISDIANQSINEDTATSALAFTLGDTVVSPGSLTVTGGSSNTTLVPNANIVFGGSGASRTVTVTPAANQSGTATITVTVGGGSSAASDSFLLTVNAQNDAPFAFTFPTNPLSIPRDTNTGDIPFTIGDLETAAASLTLTKSSGNLTLVPNANIVFGGSGANRTMRITPASGQTGSAFITIGVSDGTATTTTILQLTVTAPAVTTISDIANLSIDEDSATSALAFTLGDTVVSPGSLTVTGGSSNTTLVPNANIVFGGSGASRTVTVTPAANQSGTATITVTVGDGSTAASDSFVLTVTSQNDAPTLSGLSDRTIAPDTDTGLIALTLADVDSPVAGLVLTGGSNNQTLVPDANIVFGGSGADRTVLVTPAAGQTGTANIMVRVSDGALHADAFFNLTVEAAAADPLLVTTLVDENDQPAGRLISLREAVREAPAGSTIRFSPLLSGLTIQLVDQILLDKAVHIDAGNLPGGIRVAGSGINRIFQVTAGGVTGAIDITAATGSTATQSTDWFAGLYPASDGIDGDLGNFTHTLGAPEDSNPTWEVDFHRDVLLDRIRVHNRDSCCGERLSDITVTVLDANGFPVYDSALLNPNNLLDAPEYLEVSLPGPVSARKVQVRRDPASTFGESSFLSIGELEVFLGVTLTRLTLVDGNEVSSVHGGGIFNEGTLTLVDCTLTRCRATTHGGALRNSGTLLLHRCTLSQNAAFYGSALFNDIDRVATLIQCTLADNTSGGGGAIYNQGVMDLSHCTIVGRWDLPGQRISNGPTGDLRLKHCIVTCNALSGCGPNIGVQRMDLINEGVVERLGANILLDYTDSNGGTSSGPAPIEAIAQLASLGAYGGPTPTCPPLPGSSALDMAVDSTETVDQRGFSRPIGAAADLGAAEYRPDLVVTTADDELDEPAGVLLSLREAMRDAEPDTRIRFDASLSGQTLTLTRGELTEDKNLTIDALDLPAAFTISGNRASRIFFVVPNRSLSLSGLHLTKGNASLGSGGGIFAVLCTLTLNHVQVFDNAAGDGGGVAAFGANLSANNSTFSGNSASLGGGFDFIGFDEIRFPLFTHCTFSGNSSTSTAGGVYHLIGLSYFRHCTFSGNAAPLGRGGGIFSQGDPTKTWLSHCIVAGNGGGDLASADNPVYSFSSAGGNLIGLGDAGGSGTFTQPGDRTGVTDPRLAPLGYHGGRTQTMPILAGSPAIDPVGGLDSSPFASDQRGYARVRDGEGNGTPVVDSGAVEAGNATWVDTTSDLTADDGQTTLREAIAAAAEPGARVLFDPAVFPDAIRLAQGELTVDRSIVLDAGNIAGGVTVDGQVASRIFTTAAGGILDISPATGASATQSTALNNQVYPASNALDGDLDNFTHTDEEDPDPTWSVDFGRDIWIDTITLHNRADCCPERLSDITVRVYTGTEAPYQLVYQSPVLNPLNSLQGPALLKVRLPAALSARRIEIKRDPASADAPGVLSLGEVQVSLDGGASIIGMTLVNGNGSGARQSGQGGAILNLGSLDLRGCTVRDNTSPDQGGGLANYGALRASDCLLANNVSAVSGGAVHTTGDDASLEIINSTLTQNRADGAGGGGVNHFSIGTTILTHCTVVGNQAPNGGGGGLRLAGGGGMFLLANSIVAQNTAPTRPNLSSAIVETGANVIGGNPRLAPLADYGGPTLTMASAIDSPARDASTNSTTRVDQRGFFRDNTPDLGAYEAGPASNYAAWIWESLPFSSTTTDRDSETDLDGDHATNGEEYAMRTQPNLVTSVLKVSALTPTTLTFSSVAGMTYRLQSAPDLLPGGDTVWTDIGAGIAGTGSDITLDLPAGETGVVYRVRVGP